ncbi:hypothetical protein ACFL2Q_08560 [Thermodesulfobacteriota bacterium]
MKELIGGKLLCAKKFPPEPPFKKLQLAIQATRLYKAGSRKIVGCLRSRLGFRVARKLFHALL